MRMRINCTEVLKQEHAELAAAAQEAYRQNVPAAGPGPDAELSLDHGQLVITPTADKPKVRIRDDETDLTLEPSPQDGLYRVIDARHKVPIEKAGRATGTQLDKVARSIRRLGQQATRSHGQLA